VAVSGLFEAVRAGTLDDVRQALDAKPDLATRDDKGWTALDWAAGRGDIDVVRALLDAGADPHATSEDQRSAYQIALAAGHRDTALTLREAEDPTGGTDRRWRPYCKAYPLSELRRFPGFPEAGSDEEIAFLHDDLTVTKSMWPGEDVIYDDVTEEWARFCTEELRFEVPDELDLVP
jgi:ankyrin repeat protein